MQSLSKIPDLTIKLAEAKPKMEIDSNLMKKQKKNEPLPMKK
jgi:hypothetical protein